MGLSFSTICERMRAHGVYLAHGLRFPCATEEEIQACEVRLGVPLPPMLRELYMTVANGSDFFGPGYSFATISDKRAEHGSGYPVLGASVGDGPRPFDDTTVEALHSHPGSFIVCEKYPAGFVAFAHFGCDIWVTLDGFSGHLYLREGHYEDGESAGWAFSFLATSLEEWLERTLSTPPSNSSEGRYQPHEPLAAVLAASADEGPNDKKSAAATRKLTGRWLESPLVSFRKRMLTGLENARMEITQQIYALDKVQRSIVASSQGRRDELDTIWEPSSCMQQLADLEAQLDALIRDMLITRP